MSDLHIKQEVMDGQLTVLRLDGEFEGFAALDAAEELIKYATEDKSPAFMVDLSGIRYVDSAAIGVLIQMAKKTAERKIKISLLNASDNVKKVLSATKVDAIFTIL